MAVGRPDTTMSAPATTQSHTGMAGQDARFRIDCHTCLLVQTGERADYMGLPCGECGRVPRSPYTLHTPTKHKGVFCQMKSLFKQKKKSGLDNERTGSKVSNMVFMSIIHVCKCNILLEF